MSDNINFDYKNLSPFKWFVLENFPFIEADFDALTEWQLFCKIGKEINKIIDSQNIVGEQAETLTNAFNTLKNYVDNYFENLDVQDEINNKLNEMVEDGTFERLIDDYTSIPELTSRVTRLENQLLNKKVIVIGDSYTQQNFDDITYHWYEIFRDNLNLTFNQSLFVRAQSGGGFANEGFLNCINYFTTGDGASLISNKNEITDILVVGGWNDRSYGLETIHNKMSAFNNVVKTNFPNAKVTIAFVGNSAPSIRQSTENRGGVFACNKQYRESCAILKWNYILNAPYILHNYKSTYWEQDGVHPSQLGQNLLGNYLSFGFLNGFVDIHYADLTEYSTISASGLSSSILGTNCVTGIDNENSYINSNESLICTPNDTMQFNGQHIYEIATLNGNYYNGNSKSNGNVNIPIIVQYTVSGVGTVRKNGIASLGIEYGKIYLIRPTCYDDSYQSLNIQPTSLIIPQFNIRTSSQYA